MILARQHVNDREGWPVPDDVHAALAGLLEACGDDPFVLVGLLVEFSHAMPAENRGALAAGLALCGAAGTRGAAVLLLLDPDRVVRRAVAEALATVASSLSPTEVRRLVAMRNWRPENERARANRGRGRVPNRQWPARGGDAPAGSAAGMNMAGAHRAVCLASRRQVNRRQAVASKPRLDRSPEQIGAWLKRTHPEDE